MVRFYFRHANGIGVLERVTVGFDERKINLEEFDTGEDRIYTKMILAVQDQDEYAAKQVLSSEGITSYEIVYTVKEWVRNEPGITHKISSHIALLGGNICRGRSEQKGIFVLSGKIVDAALVIFEFTDRNLYQIAKEVVGQFSVGRVALQLVRLEE
jgi:hypothetical protein